MGERERGSGAACPTSWTVLTASVVERLNLSTGKREWIPKLLAFWGARRRPLPHQQCHQPRPLCLHLSSLVDLIMNPCFTAPLSSSRMPLRRVCSRARMEMNFRCIYLEIVICFSKFYLYYYVISNVVILCVYVCISHALFSL